jgi:hypothetical protein
MPPVELNDLGTKEGGLTPNQLAVAVMKNVTSNIIGAATTAALDLSKTGGAGTAEGVRKIGESIKGIFGGKK